MSSLGGPTLKKIQCEKSWAIKREWDKDRNGRKRDRNRSKRYIKALKNNTQCVCNGNFG